MTNQDKDLTVRNRWAIVLIFLISVITYANSLTNKFVFDDYFFIVKNSFIKNNKYIPQILKNDMFYFQHYRDNNIDYRRYRPIATLSYAFDYRIWKLNPFGYHLMNLFLHTLNSILLFYLILILFRNFDLALLSSVLFVMHPIHTSCVNFLAARDNLLATCFGLSSIICYIFSRSTKSKIYYPLSLLFFLFCILSKEPGLLFIPLIVLCGFNIKTKKADILKSVFPFLFICLCYVLLRLFLKMPFFTKDMGLSVNIPLEILNFFNIIINYLILIILPFNLHLLRTTDFLVSFISMRSVCIIIFAFSLVFLLLWSIKHKKEIIWFGTAWFIIALSFVMKSMYVKPYLGAGMFEWWVYLPSMGFFVILGYLLLSLFKRLQKAFIFLFLGISVFWISLGIYNNTVWANEITLYTHTLNIKPHNLDIIINLAISYLESGKYDKAEKQFLRALKLEPGDYTIYVGLGNVYNALGQSEKALEMYKLSLALKPDSAEAFNNIGRIYLKNDDNQSALNAFLQALKYNAENDVIYYNLGLFFLLRDDYKKAVDYFIKATEFNPDNDMYFAKLGISYASDNLFKEALGAFNKALSINPYSIEAMVNLGNLYGNTGNLHKAISLWEKVKALDPNNEAIKQRIKIAEDLLKSK